MRLAFLLGFLALLPLWGTDMVPLFAKIYPKILAYDYRSGEKAVEGEVRLGVVYAPQSRYDLERFMETASAQQATAGGYPVAVRPVAFEEALEQTGKFAGIVLLGALEPEKLSELVRAAEKSGTILFATLPDQLDAGAAVGLYLGKSLLPVVNKEAIRKADIRFRPAFLKLVRIHGE